MFPCCAQAADDAATTGGDRVQVGGVVAARAAGDDVGARGANPARDVPTRSQTVADRRRSGSGLGARGDSQRRDRGTPAGAREPALMGSDRHEFVPSEHIGPQMSLPCTTSVPDSCGGLRSTERWPPSFGRSLSSGRQVSHNGPLRRSFFRQLRWRHRYPPFVVIRIPDIAATWTARSIRSLRLGVGCSRRELLAPGGAQTA